VLQSGRISPIPSQNSIDPVRKGPPSRLTSWDGKQTTTSENHPGWRLHSVDARGDVGGDFTSTKSELVSDIIMQTLTGTVTVSGFPPTTYNWARYNGTVLPLSPSSMPFPPSAGSSDFELNAWGAKAVANCKPTNSIADAAAFLGELMRDGTPARIGSSIAKWKGLTARSRKLPAKEYLNVEFGWKPMIRDMMAMAFAVAHADKVLSQYQRDSGKLVRRRFEFKPEIDASFSLIADGVSPNTLLDHSALYKSNAFVNKGRVVRVRTTTRRRWFSGAFTYHIPQGSSSFALLRKDVLLAKKLLGIAPTPEAIWELTPWSWATDWVLNTGDVISNLTDWALDGLVMKYGYIMEESKTVDQYLFTGETGFQSPVIPSVVELVSSTKLRRKANPFGFGVTWGGLSPRQLAIAAALGLTHS